MSGSGADYRGQLLDSLARAKKQAGHLRYSLDRIHDAESLPEAERLERYEAATGRFSRLQDMLLAPFRAVAHIELEPDKAGRTTDLLNFMEKLGIVGSVADWRELRRLRNAIAHEYWDDEERVRQLLADVERMSGTLFATAEALDRYAHALPPP